MILKGREFAAFVSVLYNFPIAVPLQFVQRQIAFGAADIPGQDHAPLPGFPRALPAGFPSGAAFAESRGPAVRRQLIDKEKFRAVVARLNQLRGYGGSGFVRQNRAQDFRLLRPTTRKTTRSAASSTGRVRVMRRALSFTTIGVLTQRDV